MITKSIRKLNLYAVMRFNSGDPIQWFEYIYKKIPVTVIADDEWVYGILFNCNFTEYMTHITKPNLLMNQIISTLDTLSIIKKLPLKILFLDNYTDSEKKILSYLAKIPYGEILSYKELAIRSGYPKGARFIGNVMADNLFPLLLPCHRVVKSDGSIGNYGGGVHVKKILLEGEGVFLS